jgi:Domain of unknown function (DUF4259)
MVKRRLRLKLGDIVEIYTSRGLAFAQYVNRHTKLPNYGTLMRILPGIFPERPLDFEPTVNAEGSYCCFWQISSDLAGGKIQIVANVAIPKQHRKMPLFKWGMLTLRTGGVSDWEIWNPKVRKLRPIAQLSEEQKDFPILDFVSLEDVTMRIENGWHPRDACRNDPGLCVINIIKNRPKEASVERQTARRVLLFENDAAWDAWAEISDGGIRFVRAAIADIQKVVRRGIPEREPANAAVAIAAIILAKHGYMPRELRSTQAHLEAVEALPSKINMKLINDLIPIVESIRLNSEVQLLWKEEGLEREWSRKVRTLTTRLKQLVDSEKSAIKQ